MLTSSGEALIERPPTFENLDSQEPPGHRKKRVTVFKRVGKKRGLRNHQAESEHSPGQDRQKPSKLAPLASNEESDDQPGQRETDLTYRRTDRDSQVVVPLQRKGAVTGQDREVTLPENSP